MWLTVIVSSGKIDDLDSNRITVDKLLCQLAIMCCILSYDTCTSDYQTSFVATSIRLTLSMGLIVVTHCS